MRAFRSGAIFLLGIAPALLAAQPEAAASTLYAALGTDVIRYDLDARAATLARRDAVTLPANVQEAWLPVTPPLAGKVLYVAWSNGGASYGSSPVPPKGDRHGVTAFRIDPRTGALRAIGEPAALPSRPIFVTADPAGAFLLTAHNNPSALTVHRILADGAPGPEVAQPGNLDFGVYGHQVRVDPAGQTVILVTRGNGPTASQPEDPGALKLFSLRDGVLSNRLSIAPAGGFGYQVRHVDFHPSGNWAFVTLERQNQIHVYRRMPDGTLGTAPLFVRSTLMAGTRAGPSQTAASIHFHPNGRFVYVANRATDTVDFNGGKVFSGGENTIAVFAVNQTTGEPTLIQTVDTRGFTPRTFALDPSGTLLVVANQAPLAIRDGEAVKNVPASLALFRIGADGKLTFARKYDAETNPDRNLFWVGMVGR